MRYLLVSVSPYQYYTYSLIIIQRHSDLIFFSVSIENISLGPSNTGKFHLNNSITKIKKIAHTHKGANEGKTKKRRAPKAKARMKSSDERDKASWTDLANSCVGLPLNAES